MGQDRLSPAPVSIGPSVSTAGTIHFVTAAIVRIPSTQSPWRSSVAAAATTVAPATHSLSVLTFLHRSARLACPSLFSFCLSIRSNTICDLLFYTTSDSENCRVGRKLMIPIRKQQLGFLAM